MIENLKDGRIRIIAKGEDEKIKWFTSAIDIKNTMIHVSSMEKEYSLASNGFGSFGKLVAKGETDAWLDTAAGYLKELVFEVKNLNLSEYLIPIKTEKLEEGVYLATSDALQGLVAQGRAIAETMEIAQDVARKLIDSYIEHGYPLPKKMALNLIVRRREARRYGTFPILRGERQFPIILA